MSFRVNMNGSLFGGAANDDLVRTAERVQHQIAAQALADVHIILDQNIKNPTPYYETQIMTQDINGATVVHDRWIVYGPWLEGTSARNRATRFKGYAAFRRAAARVEEMAFRFMEREVANWITRNG